ncbi:MAG: N-acyl homoserine lactonase family protein [Marinibacterium sp.]|nr:N-acyl homoserine lactonase family protein [Marinibacterium sp.]
MQAKGYLKGRPLSLTVLDYGLFKVHANERVIGICGYLIRTDAGENVLVDTGFPAKYAEDTETATQEDRLYEFGEVLQCGPENLPAAQLAKVGLGVEDVTLHILTHSHIDHVGALHDFAHLPIVMAAVERALPKPLYWGGAQPMDWPEARYLLVENDVALGPGFDLFFAPGHAPGQLAMRLVLPETGPVLLTSDAISRPAEIDERFAGSWNEPAAIASADRLMALARQDKAFVIFGHCPEQWPDLRKAPDSYA